MQNDQDEDAVDRAIAQAALDQLREDRAAGFDHRLFARASSITAARQLVDLYTGLGGQVAAIDSSISKRRQDQVEEALLGGQLDGVVCVDMFGEGYDFPKLKVAALHAPHRSLVPTLQFRYRQRGHQQWIYAQITDLELATFAVNGPELSFEVVSEQHQLPFTFSIAGGQLIRPRNANWESELSSSHDEWLDFATWLSMHPPVFYAADKSSFEGMNSFPTPALVARRLADGDARDLDWTGCEIGQEFDSEDPDRVTVQKHLERVLSASDGLEVLVYDHRTGEAADFIAITREPDDRYRVSLYHCKGAGGAPSGGRVNDVYEVTCQLLKSVVYCDANALTDHIEHRINPGRHLHPSRFIVGSFERTQEVLLNHPADRIEFAIYGVQPGISLAAVDEHLTDLMAFSLDYVRRGGAAIGQWIVNA